MPNQIEATACTCDLTTGCGEADEAGCPTCRIADVYLPCPVFGFMCDPLPVVPGGPAYRCDCCTPEQQRMTRAWYCVADTQDGTPNA